MEPVVLPERMHEYTQLKWVGGRSVTNELAPQTKENKTILGKQITVVTKRKEKKKEEGKERGAVLGHDMSLSTKLLITQSQGICWLSKSQS